jgi:acyl-CoA-binding protein
MRFRQGTLYEFPKISTEKIYMCTNRLSNGWVFNEVHKDDYIMISNSGFVVEEFDELDEQFLHCKQHFREMPKTDLSKELFKLAFKIAKCGDIDPHMPGSDADILNHYEYEHGVFSEFWKVPREKEQEWLKEPIDRRFRINDEIYFEDSEQVETALLKIRMVKQYVAELRLGEGNEKTDAKGKSS